MAKVCLRIIAVQALFVSFSLAVTHKHVPKCSYLNVVTYMQLPTADRLRHDTTDPEQSALTRTGSWSAGWNRQGIIKSQ